MNTLSLIFFLIGIFISIPFLTLVERKILSYGQSRKGPNKVSFIGVLQPISDGVKLLCKESGVLINSNSIIFWLSPVFSFLLMLLAVLSLNTNFSCFSIQYSFLFFLAISSLHVYTLFFSGLASNSKYTLLGAFRGSAQVISYEVSLIFLFMVPCIFSESYNASFFFFNNNFLVAVSFFSFVLWLLNILAESNRSPFDFAEGESELVSGFNTEYSSFIFALFFLGEYGNIIVISLVTSIVFFSSFVFTLISLFIINFFLWARLTFPRFRYDLLMEFSWKVIFPFTFFYFFLVLFLF